MIKPESFTRALADPTRLRILMLLLQREELCVCHLTGILEIVQPKVSRHLAVLRENKLLLDRRSGLWIYYRLNPAMPIWCYKTLQALLSGCMNAEPYKNDMKRLDNLDICSGANKRRWASVAGQSLGDEHHTDLRRTG